MRRVLNRTNKGALYLFFTLVLSSCILDEFTADELKMKEDWKMEVAVPLFKGDFEFKDLIYDWSDLSVLPGEQTTILKFPEGQSLEIPLRILFEPTTLVNNFDFWINGNYNFSKIDLKYRVSNGSPFPFNFQSRFAPTAASLGQNPAILPPPFAAAKQEGDNYSPVETIHILTLDNEQIQSIANGEMVQFETWFDQSELVLSLDTFLSDYPVTISIVLYGELNAKL